MCGGDPPVREERGLNLSPSPVVVVDGLGNRRRHRLGCAHRRLSGGQAVGGRRPISIPILGAVAASPAARARSTMMSVGIHARS